MALSETENSDCNSDSSADGTSKQERKEKLLTKIVVRRLPPSMNKETFLNQVSPLPDYDYMYFVKADMSLGEYAFSRAYINFKNPTDIFIFKEKFDNYVFLDSKGNEYVAVVEFAPFSRIPKKRNRNRIDLKCGSIETDAVYLQFIESLKEISETEEKPEYCFQPSIEDEKNKVVNTPLLDYIKQRRIDRQKMKEERREERKRREFERKKIKDDDRKGRKRFDNITHSSSITKLSPSKSSSLDVIEESKSEPTIKPKERKYDDYKTRNKPPPREYEKRTYISSRDVNRSVDRKSPSKIRPRSTGYMEKEVRRTEYKSKRDEYVNKNYRDSKEDKIVEKKVKKYSERREERKNEIKKIDKTESIPTTSKDDKQEVKEILSPKSPEIKEKSPKFNIQSSKETEEKKRDYEKSYDRRETSRIRENDPRTQRRIRNKDRPTMAIYQPGMGFARNNRKPSSESCTEDNSKEKSSSKEPESE